MRAWVWLKGISVHTVGMWKMTDKYWVLIEEIVTLCLERGWDTPRLQLENLFSLHSGIEETPEGVLCICGKTSGFTQDDWVLHLRDALLADKQQVEVTG